MKKTKDLSRARQSMAEELQAIDLYSERSDASKNKALIKVMQENAYDEREHATKLLNWIKKNDKKQKFWLKKMMV